VRVVRGGAELDPVLRADAGGRQLVEQGVSPQAVDDGIPEQVGAGGEAPVGPGQRRHHVRVLGLHLVAGVDQHDPAALERRHAGHEVAQAVVARDAGLGFVLE
jgi:hypothetical protein